jgi:ABC-2 type transport system ATP-binding protein
VIEVRGLTKRYGSAVAVDRLSFEVPPGAVTGFLGLNGSGKSTTMRMILGLDSPDAGHARIGGQPYRRLRWPLREAGGLLEPRAFHPGRSARAHLAALAASNAISQSRVGEVLELVGLQAVARKRAGKFSLGMAQRLGIAAALLGDPAVLLLDEPVNGLDPEGIRWMRGLLRSLAAEGRAVLVSSHLISEMAVMADRLVVIGKGWRVTKAAAVQQCGRPARRAACLARLCRAHPARSRICSINRTRSACVAAIGMTFSVVTPESRNAATRSATSERGPISDVPASSDSGTSAAASSLRPDR